MTDLALLLLQQGSTGNPTAVGIFRFFAGFFIVMTLYIGAWSFTYWISKDE
jgi:hypothetical protein